MNRCSRPSLSTNWRAMNRTTAWPVVKRLNLFIGCPSGKERNVGGRWRQRHRLLEKPECEPSQIFDFDLCTLDEILGPVLYHNHPAKSGNCEKRHPEHQTKIEHLATIRVSGFHRKAPGKTYRRISLLSPEPNKSGTGPAG